MAMRKYTTQWVIAIIVLIALVLAIDLLVIKHNKKEISNTIEKSKSF